METHLGTETEASRTHRDFSVRDALNVIWRRIFWLKLVVIGLPTAVLVSCLLVSPVYRTSAKIMIQAKKENTTLLQATRDPAFSSYVNLNVDEIDVNSEMELLQSMDLWVSLVKKLGLDKERRKNRGPVREFVEDGIVSIKEFLGLDTRMEKAGLEDSLAARATAQALLKDFKVVPVPKSKILDLTFDYDDPVKVKEILSTLLDLYIPYHLQANAVEGAQSFFSGQGDMYKKKLDDAEQGLAAFKKQWGLSLPEKQKTELISVVKQLEDSLIEANANFSQYEYMLTSIKRGVMPTGQLTPSQQRGGENTVLTVIASQLIRAEQKRLQTQEIFGADSRDYKAAEDAVQDLSHRFQSSIQVEVDILQKKKASIEESLKKTKEALQTVEEKSEESKDLQLKVLIAKERYLQYVTKEEEARLENLKLGDKLVNVNIVAKPFVPARPVFPRKVLFTLLAFFVSFPLGIGLILMANLFDHTFDDPRDIEQHTGYKVLASMKLLNKGGVGSS
jgi:uncharacterized protein involved in exopolysaccharide biosynthesis